MALAIIKEKKCFFDEIHKQQTRNYHKPQAE
jgi:hypothetical protein